MCVFHNLSTRESTVVLCIIRENRTLQSMQSSDSRSNKGEGTLGTKYQERTIGGTQVLKEALMFKCLKLPTKNDGQSKGRGNGGQWIELKGRVVFFYFTEMRKARLVTPGTVVFIML